MVLKRSHIFIAVLSLLTAALRTPIYFLISLFLIKFIELFSFLAANLKSYECYEFHFRA